MTLRFISCKGQQLNMVRSCNIRISDFEPPTPPQPCDWRGSYSWARQRSSWGGTKPVPVWAAAPPCSRGRGRRRCTAEARWCSRTGSGWFEVLQRSAPHTPWRSPAGLSYPKSPQSNLRRLRSPGTPSCSEKEKCEQTKRLTFISA